MGFFKTRFRLEINSVNTISSVVSGNRSLCREQWRHSALCLRCSLTSCSLTTEVMVCGSIPCQNHCLLQPNTLPVNSYRSMPTVAYQIKLSQPTCVKRGNTTWQRGEKQEGLCLPAVLEDSRDLTLPSSETRRFSSGLLCVQGELRSQFTGDVPGTVFLRNVHIHVVQKHDI